MTEADVVAIETRFQITLPQDLRRLLLNYPEELVGQWKPLHRGHDEAIHELYNDPALSIEYNEDARRPDGTPWTADDGPWPEEFFIIGDDRCGNYWCVDLTGQSAGVWVYDHDTGAFEPEADSLAEFVSIVTQVIREVDSDDER